MSTRPAGTAGSDPSRRCSGCRQEAWPSPSSAVATTCVGCSVPTRLPRSRMPKALLAAVPALVIMLNWLRLEHPQRDGGRVLVLVLLAVVPALGRNARERVGLLVGSSVIAVSITTRLAPRD